MPSCVRCLTVIAAMLMSAAGCGPQEIPKAMVRGIVTLNGSPLKEGAIKFVPVEGNAPTAGAILKSDGTYSTEVPVGFMRVEISSVKVIGTRKAFDTPDSPKIEITEEQIPEKYNVKTELKYEVVAGEKEVDADFDLTTAKK